MFRNDESSLPNHFLDSAKELSDDGTFAVVYQCIWAYVPTFGTLVQSSFAGSWIERWRVRSIWPSTCRQSLPEVFWWQRGYVCPASSRQAVVEDDALRRVRLLALTESMTNPPTYMLQTFGPSPNFQSSVNLRRSSFSCPYWVAHSMYPHSLYYSFHQGAFPRQSWRL